MAGSLIGGLLNSNWPGTDLSVSEPVPEAREALQRRFGHLGVTCVDDNAGCAAAEVVVLAVKPQVLRAAVQSAAAALQRSRPLLISIAAGIRCADVLRWAGVEMALVRAMPNTPALINAGVSGLFANPLAGARERDLAEAILGAVGETLWVGEEALLDTVTGISGSGPAYLFKWMELLAAGAEAHGLDRDAARALVVQTALGAALLAKHGGQAPHQLRRRVTSRGGTTEAALEQMEALGLDEAVRRGIDAAIRRSAQIADQFGAA